MKKLMGLKIKFKRNKGIFMIKTYVYFENITSSFERPEMLSVVLIKESYLTTLTFIANNPVKMKFVYKMFKVMQRGHISLKRV